MYVQLEHNATEKGHGAGLQVRHVAATTNGTTAWLPEYLKR